MIRPNRQMIHQTLSAGMLSIALGVSTPVGAHEFNQLGGEIDAVVVKHLAADQVPGIAVIVVAENEVVYARGYGRATGDGGVVTPTTSFSIGSVTKPFVGLAIDRLVQQKKLSLDRPVVEYLPDFTPQSAYTDLITVRHLLNHSSGFNTYVGNRNQVATEQGPGFLQATLAELNTVELQSAPGEQFEYSNANYQVLGMLIEQITQMSFADAMHTLVFEPLDLHATRVGHAFGQANVADGFRFWGNKPVVYRTPLGSVLEPQGGISSTADDLGRFLLALTGTSVAPPLWNPAWAIGVPADTPNMSYGLGWFVHQVEGEQVILHHGLNPGFSAVLAFSPARAMGIAVVGNASDGFMHGDVNFVMEEIVAQVFPTLGANPMNYSVAWIQLGVMLLLCMLMIVWAILVVMRWSGGRLAKKSLLRTLVPSVMPLGLAYLIGVWLPPQIGIPLAAAGMFSPDIGLLLQATVWLCAGWGVVRLLLVVDWRENPGYAASGT